MFKIILGIITAPFIIFVAIVATLIYAYSKFMAIQSYPTLKYLDYVILFVKNTRILCSEKTAIIIGLIIYLDAFLIVFLSHIE